MEIIDYPRYLIYDDGRVWSKFGKGRFLKPAKDHAGYWRVALCKDGIASTKKVHRLVALHYIENLENKKEVDHINRIPTDNRVENLRWTTKLENQQNKSLRYNNTSGHKGIKKHGDGWQYKKTINKKTYTKYFKSKIDCICFKYIYTLIISNHCDCKLHRVLS